MDKILSRYTVKRQTLRLNFFYNMIEITSLASYVIYKENNS